AEFPITRRASDQDRADSERLLREKVLKIRESSELSYVNVSDLDRLDRQFLVERQLISREHAEAQGARGVVIDSGERISLMINEEDHLRIQCMHSGLDVQGAWEQINRIDDLISEHVNYAFHPRLGYLTACPPNVS